MRTERSTEWTALAQDVTSALAIDIPSKAKVRAATSTVLIIPAKRRDGFVCVRFISPI
ncbi:hypothetical protein CHELA20_40166 [Hyphomicrobiales bacterium]|nr:hypothetical protein CHELA20_40166 [Hyphomicrobiales bacterium]CAH1686955.1 hypothetical protein CHELA41_30068 [Hyphomicrobiales bacterium]